MTERPILFSGAMVKAILGGTKTQTRRVVKNPNDGVSTLIEDGQPFYCDETGDWHPRPSPYGKPGDRLWARERHCFLDVSRRAPPQQGYRWNVTVEYSDGTEHEGYGVNGLKPKQTRERGEQGWRPSIHMPRWACRLKLEVTGIHVERLQDISGEDAWAEGVSDGPRPSLAIHCYRRLWDALNAKRGFGWDTNPWVWVVEFKRCDKGLGHSNG